MGARPCRQPGEQDRMAVPGASEGCIPAQRTAHDAPQTLSRQAQQEGGLCQAPAEGPFPQAELPRPEPHPQGPPERDSDGPRLGVPDPSGQLAQGTRTGCKGGLDKEQEADARLRHPAAFPERFHPRGAGASRPGGKLPACLRTGRERAVLQDGRIPPGRRGLSLRDGQARQECRCRGCGTKAVLVPPRLRRLLRQVLLHVAFLLLHRRMGPDGVGDGGARHAGRTGTPAGF